MTDARFPERWLNDRRVMTLPAEDFRAFMLSIAWCAANRTDGEITADDLAIMPWLISCPPARMVAAGLWNTTSDGWLVLDWPTHQSTRAQLEAAQEARVKARERQRRHRSTTRNDADVDDDEIDHDDRIQDDIPAGQTHVTRDNDRDVTRESTRTGQDRPGQEVLDPPESKFHQQTDERVCSAPGCLSTFGLLGVSADDGRVYCRRHHPAIGRAS